MRSLQYFWPWSRRAALFASVDAAVRDVRRWLDGQRVAVHRIETVAAFEHWSKHLGIWVFYETDAQRICCEENGLSNTIREHFLSALTDHGYPSRYLPLVSFVFDSHETVLRDYDASYFNRLR